MNDVEAEIGARSAAVLLGDVLRVADPQPDLIARAGGIEALARADAFEIAAWLEARDLDVPDGSRPPPRPRNATVRKARALVAAFELGRRVERERASPPTTLRSPDAVATWAAPRLGSLAHEELWLLALDGRGNLRAARCIAKGGLNGAGVRAADPLRAALRADASAFVLVHNHPSGDPTPSREDILFTAKAAAAARIVGIVLLDHVVVARGGFACVPVDDGEAEPLTRRAADGSAR